MNTISVPHKKLFENLKVVKIVQRFSTILGLTVPNLYNYHGLSVCYLMYSILLCFILIILTGFSFILRIGMVFDVVVLSTSLIVDILMVVIPSGTVIISMILSIFIRRRDLLRFVRTLHDVELSLNSKFSVDIGYNELIVLALCMLPTVLCLSYIIFCITTHTLNHHPEFIVHNFTYYYAMLAICVIIMQISCHMIKMRYIFKFLNRKLYKTVSYYTNMIVSDGQMIPKTKVNYVEMNFFLKKYDLLCDLVDLFDKVYGFQMLSITLVIMVVMIRNLNMTLKLALGMLKVPFPTMVNYIIFDSIFSSIVFVVLGLILAFCGDVTITETKKTSTICFKLLLNFLQNPTSLWERTTKEELYLLADLIAKRDVHFSAAGFFKIDYGLLFVIFGAIATYLVIILQFK